MSGKISKSAILVIILSVEMLLMASDAMAATATEKCRAEHVLPMMAQNQESYNLCMTYFAQGLYGLTAESCSHMFDFIPICLPTPGSSCSIDPMLLVAGGGDMQGGGAQFTTDECTEDPSLSPPDSTPDPAETNGDPPYCPQP